ncbi:short-chain dehydrogenase/reductase family oxidoreductase domain protein [Mycobacterium xenopi 3993]|nr:short-chain dehydrogenase/reductase family oxidoreductase domain protein [Mycobacterium xenopi 3993]
MDGVVPLLADRFRVIRYDNRGVGASAAPNPPRLTRWRVSPTTSPR